MERFEPNIENENLLSETKKQEILSDLKRVGPTKPLGYLPLETLSGLLNVDPKELRQELEADGLTCMILSEDESGILGGALYVYHADSLQRALSENHALLERNQWPNNATAFIHHLKHLASDPKLFVFIEKVFGKNT